MTSIVELFPKCRKLCYDARQQLSLQENGSANNSNLSLVLEELHRQLDCMDVLVLKETPDGRIMWKRKITELRQDMADMEKRQKVTSYQNQRAELLLRGRRGGNNRGEDNRTEMEQLAREGQHWQSSAGMVDDIIQTADASYASLRDQRQRLRGASRVVADMADALGLTQTTMKIIARRDITDAYLIAAGMVVTLIVLYVTWFM
jgi:golgi SNAP receptor complex member 2